MPQYGGAAPMSHSPQDDPEAAFPAACPLPAKASVRAPGADSPFAHPCPVHPDHSPAARARAAATMLASTSSRSAFASAGRASRRTVIVRAEAVTIPAGFKTIEPKGDRVLVKVGEQEEKTRGGILLPSAAQKRPTSGGWRGHCCAVRLGVRLGALHLHARRCDLVASIGPLLPAPPSQCRRRLEPG